MTSLTDLVPVPETIEFNGARIQVTGLQVQAIGGMAYVSWDEHPDLDVRIGGQIEFRHTPQTASPVWSASTGIGSAVPGASTFTVLPLKPGTYLAKAVELINAKVEYDRIVVVTDEQTHDGIVSPHGRGYVINVGTYKNGVGYGKWLHIDGWSEATIDYLRAFENAPV